MSALCSPSPTEPYKGKCQGGNPFTLANQGYTFSMLTLWKRTNNLRYLGFHSKINTHLVIEKGKMSFFSMTDPVATAF